jgi:hypothetical protein
MARSPWATRCRRSAARHRELLTSALIARWAGLCYFRPGRAQPCLSQIPHWAGAGRSPAILRFHKNEGVERNIDSRVGQRKLYLNSQSCALRQPTVGFFWPRIRHYIPKLQGETQGGMASKERTHGQKDPAATNTPLLKGGFISIEGPTVRKSLTVATNYQFARRAKL